MITNNKVTIYHHTTTNHNNVWTRYNYSNIWWFGGRGSKINKGYDMANDLDVRIPYGQNENLNIANFSIGDIVVKGSLETNITTQQDLSSYEVYNITSINDNNFGNNPHIHIGGK